MGWNTFPKVSADPDAGLAGHLGAPFPKKQEAASPNLPESPGFVKAE
jgi:hypothetical protein